MAESPFRVIIVGGSVTGLTLAHCLDRAGIDYIVLEKHQEIHPQIGASVVIFPNGGRILEQLGLYQRIQELAQRLRRIHTCFPDGFHYDNNVPEQVKKLFGMDFAILERRQLLEVLYTGLQDKAKVHTGQQVTSVLPTEAGVSVTTADGTRYDGHLVVGADGVHSFVRSEMWRIADLEQPRLISKKEKSDMTVEFACVFGISNPVEGVKSWDHVIRYNRGVTLFVFPGTDNGVFWLLFRKLDKRYTYPNTPRFTKEDAISTCESLVDLAVWENVHFGDIWRQRRTFHMTALEEGLLRTWHYGRIVCIGDSVSKMTPNQGQGANTAIEAAAGLANVLFSVRQKAEGNSPSEGEIQRMLDQFNTTQFQRLLAIHQSSEFLTRLQACDGLAKSLFARFVAPYCGGTIEGISGLATSGTALDFVPLTERSGRGWSPVSSWAPWISKMAYLGTQAFVGLAIASLPASVAWTLYKIAITRLLAR
ncbi:putative FAD-dependent monooxygenase [Aspergillus nomiae NRRL 13137]|uniref:Putative FAD-dependent monooxygenase n=1 Tax=Aspergillus nomiae NRRL (strain ATCC 15546 / NRRL 13137 / CBS 260.88 / M93) TaxID=1509407 RepID=A0A0L1JDQ2_ASPN3|nr:putative FAD-dependent monooxygenase [Aspergillus nomiae NRRL 13137]KNG89842.1 putative FAD-dependent monooxygenase [Aspergillus nomiae NRRL 13137]